jgi:hypothetical protein|nr:MAG TPA: hypothetical protein [Caudoviricetes sp.]
MIGFYKFMIVSACLLLALLIAIAGRNSFKENTFDKVLWFVLYVYAFGLLHTVYKLFSGG